MSIQFERIKLPIHGAFLIRSYNRFADDRGFFETAVDSEFLLDHNDQPLSFVQENFSHSKKGVIRGMHMQTKNPQGKLLKCVSGWINDQFYDVRRDSPTFLQGYSVALTAYRSDLLYVPPGCLHGFQALTDNAIVQYKVTNNHERAYDGGVLHSDPELGLQWNYGRSIISDKDKKLPTLEEFLKKLYG